MKKWIGAAALAAFLFALGIVGSVEQGAAVSRMWWTVPALAILAICARQAEKKYF